MREFTRHRDRREETRRLLEIGWPLTLAALTNMAVSITDVVMMGWIGPVALGAGAAVSDIYSIVFYLCAGIAAAGVPILSSLIGARDIHRLGGVVLEICAATAVVGLICVPLVWHTALLLDFLGLEREALAGARAYAHWMAAALLPMLLFRAGAAYFSAAGRTRVIFHLTLGSVPLNIIGNGVFMFGWFGFEPMGMPGAGLSSFLVSLYLLIATAALLVLDPALFRRPGLRMRADGLVACWRTGIPIGLSSLGEVGVYLISTVLMVKFGAAAVAAHAVTLRLSGLLYSIPLGLSQAVTVRVAFWSGAERADRVDTTVRAAFKLSLVTGCVYLFALSLFARPIADLFLGTMLAAGLAATLITVLAAIEFFTALGTFAFGALRGIKDTTVPMLYSLGCLWGIGFSGSMLLGFAAGLDSVGIWLGLLAGATVFACLSLVRVRRKRLIAGEYAPVRDLEPAGEGGS